MTDADPQLARAREEIAAARTLGDAGFPAQAVSRAYYAAFSPPSKLGWPITAEARD